VEDGPDIDNQRQWPFNDDAASSRVKLPRPGLSDAEMAAIAARGHAAATKHLELKSGAAPHSMSGSVGSFFGRSAHYVPGGACPVPSVVTVDGGSVHGGPQVDFPLAALSGAKTWVNLDHHISNEGYGDLHYIHSGAPAAGEIIYDLLTACQFPITPEIASNLYVAISTDTGSFQYQSTTAHTYEIGAALIRAGINVSKLCQDTYESYPLRRIELLRHLLNAMQITHGGKVASWALTRAFADSINMQPDDNEGLMDNLRSIQGVVVAAAFEELPGPDGKIRLSLRSKDPAIDVGAVCAGFGGGGHRLAAGARLAGPLSDAQSRVFQALHETFS
jgi:nanoRNase/pAp phosphatase (c-di-AMP/oligoRNAs hydrolase)